MKGSKTKPTHYKRHSFNTPTNHQQQNQRITAPPQHQRLLPSSSTSPFPSSFCNNPVSDTHPTLLSQVDNATEAQCSCRVCTSIKVGRDVRSSRDNEVGPCCPSVLVGGLPLVVRVRLV